MTSRRSRLRRGLWLEIATLGWNVLEGVVAVAAVVGWRLRAELRGRAPRDAEAIERRASRIAGALLILLASYIVVDAGRRVAGFGTAARESFVGIVLTGVSLVLMPALGWAKLRVARAIGSRALRADAWETITCAWLSLTTLAGLVLNAALGWWWADPVAALVLVPLIVREGIEGWRGGNCEEDDEECDQEAARAHQPPRR